MMGNWSKEEIVLITKDYFEMLSKEKGGISYSKTKHRNQLMPQLNSRSKGAVEYKHQNISAILDEQKLTYIRGYKPKHNYQEELKSEVLDYIKKNNLTEKIEKTNATLKLELATDENELRENIAYFNKYAKNNIELARDAVRRTWYWVYNPEENAFGPSKFIGYKKISFGLYSSARKKNPAKFSGGITQKHISTLLKQGYKPNNKLSKLLEEWGENIFGDGIFEGIEAIRAKWRFNSLPYQRNYWAAFANPRIYDVESAIKNLDFCTWTVKRSEVRKGDRIILWRGLKKGKRGIVGFAEVMTNPEEMKESPQDIQYYVSTPLKTKENRVWIKFHDLPNAPLWLGEDATGTLKKLSVAKSRGGTIFHIEPEQWSEIMKLTGGWKETEHLAGEDEVKKIQFDKEVKAKKLSMEELTKRAGKSSPRTTVRKVISKYYDRDAYVSEYAKRRANGVCQLCQAKAPFNNKKGEPYLETHHIIWLSRGGLDSVDNTVALCPNCHAKVHTLDLSSDCKKIKTNLQNCS